MFLCVTKKKKLYVGKFCKNFFKTLMGYVFVLILYVFLCDKEKICMSVGFVCLVFMSVWCVPKKYIFHYLKT